MSLKVFSFIFSFVLISSFFIAAPAYSQGDGLNEPFENPDLTGWERSPGVEVRDGYLIIPSGGFAMYSGSWGDLTLTILARRNGNGNLSIRYRGSDAGSYAFIFGSEAQRLVKESSGEIEVLQEIPIRAPEVEWVTVKIISAGSLQQIFINEMESIKVEDPDPLPAGGIGMMVDGEAEGAFDELVLVPAEAQGQQPQPSGTQEEPVSEEASMISEGELRWTYVGGPPGGLGYDIRVDFENPDIWYVTDAFAGVFKSMDRGVTWQPSNQGFIRETGTTGDDIPIFTLTVDPHNSQILWAGTKDTGKIYRSEDGGQTWEERDEGITIDYTYLAFRGFAVDPRSSDIVYAMAETTHQTPEPRCGSSNDCIGGMVYKTSDAGLHWEVIWDGGMPSSLARYMWLNPSNPDILYVSTGIFDRSAVGEEDPYISDDIHGGLGILKSTDGGQTWQILGRENGLEMLYIGSLYMHPENPDILLAAAGHIILDFEILEELKEQDSSPGGVYRTTDGGEQWEKVLSSSGDMIDESMGCVEICENDPSVAYASSDLAVYRSEDGGVTWTMTTGGSLGWGTDGVLSGMPIDMQCDPLDSNRIFVNNYLGGNFLSEDGGYTFVNASQGYTGAHSIGIVADLSQPARIFSAGRSGVWKSNDGGVTWEGLYYPTEANELDNTESFFISIDPSNPDHLLYGDMGGHMEESFDGGLTWDMRSHLRSERYLPPEAQMSGAGFVDITFAPTDNSIVYSGTATRECYMGHESCAPGNGVFYSTDGGGTWQGTTDQQIWQQSVTDITVNPEDANSLLAGATNGLLYSTDGAQTWTKVSGLQEGPTRAVEYHPSDPQYILAAVDGAGLFRSTDGGTSWEPAYAGLEPNGSIHSIVFDPANPTTVYASDHFSGVYRSTDGGMSWIKINDGLTNRAVNTLAISANGQHLYVTSVGNGIFRLDLNGQPPASVMEEDSPVVSETAQQSQPAAQEPETIPTESESQEIPAPEEEIPAASRSSGWILYTLGGGGLLLTGTLVYLMGRKLRHK